MGVVRLGSELPPRWRDRESVERKDPLEIIRNSILEIDSLGDYLRLGLKNSGEQDLLEEQKVATLDLIHEYAESLLIASDVDIEEVYRLNYLIVSFSDLAIANRMADFELRTGSFNSRYAREDKFEGREVVLTDELYRILNTGDITPFRFYSKDKPTDSSVENNDNPERYLEPDEYIVQIQELLSGLQENRADRYYVRKMNLGLSASEADLDEYERKHIEHYKNFFELNGREPDDVYLMNSGTKANDSVIKTLLQTYPDAKASYLHGWYYENVERIKEFNVTSPEDANIVFLNNESSNPIDPELYEAQFQSAVFSVIDSAKQNPDSRFFLVTDSTTDLLSGEEIFDKLPSNVSFIKTFSLTKHQRGGRNFFYGGAAVWSADSDFKETMAKTIVENDAALGSFEKIHFPRLRKSEIEKNVEHIEELQTAFRTSFEEGQKDLPDYLKCKFYDYNYFTYIHTPFSAISGVRSICPLKQGDREIFKSADSFGLEETRLAGINDTIEGYSTGRLSYGSASTIEDMIELGKYSAMEWVEYANSQSEQADDQRDKFFKIRDYLSEANFDKKSLTTVMSDFLISLETNVRSISKIITSLTGSESLDRMSPNEIDENDVRLKELENLIISHESETKFMLDNIPGVLRPNVDSLFGGTYEEFAEESDFTNTKKRIIEYCQRCYLIVGKRKFSIYQNPREYLQYVENQVSDILLALK